MAFDQEAIYKAYSNVVTICDEASDGKGFIRDEDGNDVTIDQSLVDAARVTLDAEAAAIAYQSTRQPLYPSLGDFADAMYWNSKGDSSKLTAYYTACEKSKPTTQNLVNYVRDQGKFDKRGRS